MTIRDIITKHLRKIGADGLAGEECGCSIDDIQPCCDSCLDCVPAMLVRANHDGDGYCKGDMIYEPMGKVAP